MPKQNGENKMYTMHLFKGESKKATVIKKETRVDCLFHLKTMNDGIRKHTKEEPSWTKAYCYPDGDIDKEPVVIETDFLNI